MSTPTPAGVGGGVRRASGDKKEKGSPTAAPNVVTRNGARQAKIQTRAMATARKPATASAALLAHKKKAMQKKKACVDTVLRDHYQTAMDAKHLVRGPTGLTSDPRMLEHRCLWDPNYPECPERLSSVLQRCEELGLINQCKLISSRAASEEEVNVLHSPLVHNILKSTHQSRNIEVLEEVSSKYDAVYIHPSSHELALLAAGSTIDMVEAIVKGDVQNGVAFVRPPGHHAMKAEPCGYCFYNNVALAARHAIDKLGLNRILIVDWDVHHGQATQQMFYDDPRVVYFSIHRYEHGAFWPNLRQSNFNYVGSGAGRGYNFNVPLNHTSMKDEDYLAVWHQLLLPMAFEYQPELVLVSAGYDAALGCPEGEMLVTPACYAHLTHALLAVCSRTCVVLEGGYCLQSLAEGAALTLRTLLGYAPPLMQPRAEPSNSIRETILNCIYAHKPYWRCYNFQPTFSLDTSIPNVDDGEKEKHTVQVRWDGDETRPDRFATRDCYPVQSREFLDDVRNKLNHLQIVTDLSIPEHAVCYIYDEAMLKHKNVCEPGHVECPERILRIHSRHRDYELLPRLHHVTPRPATDEEILMVHSEGHLAMLKELSATKLRDLRTLQEKYDSVYLHPDSLDSARVAAGCALQMVEEVLSGVGGCGVCAVRPPGHHADDDTPSGFCLLNNAALAASYATRCHGLSRVLLLDWDVHHGNGTQKIFESDPRVLYMSIHRYDNGSFFPHSKNADYTSVGVGRGEGFTVNIPWNKRGMGDTEYLAAFTNVVLPIAYEFDPQLVIVSAGFDACVGDPLGGCKVSPECYGRLTHLLRGLAQGRVILCLEGGYNITSISYAMTMCTKALLGDPIPHFYEPKQTCHWSAVESINNVIKVQKKYWKSLKFQVALPVEDVLGEPAPSRGLIFPETDHSATGDQIRLSESYGFNSSTSTLNDTAKSDQYNLSILDNLRKSITSVDESLEDSLSSLQIASNEAQHSSSLTNDKKESIGEVSMDNLSLNTPAGMVALVKDNKEEIGEMSTANVSLNTSTSSVTSEKRVTRSSSKSFAESNNRINESVEYCNQKYEQGNCGPDDQNCTPKQNTSKNTSTGNITMNTSNASITSERRTTRSSSKAKSPQSSPDESQKSKAECVDGNCGTDDESDATKDYAKKQVNPPGSAGNSSSETPNTSTNNDSPGKQSLVDYLAANMASAKKELNPADGAGNSSREKANTSACNDSPKETLVDYLAANMASIVNEDMFAVIPLQWCPHLESLYSIPENVRFEQGVRCIDCEHTEENWVCLHCYVVACARSINAHMQAHYTQTQHPLVLSLVDLSVWCNECDAYVDNALLYDAKNLAHQSKFGEPMPWCYPRDTIHMH